MENYKLAFPNAENLIFSCEITTKTKVIMTVESRSQEHHRIREDDDIDLSMPQTTETGERCNGSGKQDAGNGDDNNNNDDIDEGDTTDGAPPMPESHVENVAKRRPIQSRRMQEYKQQIISNKDVRQQRKCPYCNRILYSGPGYRYHIKRHRPDKESYSCDTCPKTFKSSNGLKYHQKGKKCRGGGKATSSKESNAGNLTASASPDPSQPEAETGNKAGRLIEFANIAIATGPQNPPTESRGSVPSSSFNDSETSAVIALSSMKKKCTRESRNTSERLDSGSSHPTGSMKPKRPMNCFMLFAQQNRAVLNKQYPEMNNRMISTKLSEEWKNLPESDRQKWKEEARLKAEEHKKKYPDCWKRKK
ncbi:unnamed protein product [Lymnaea stagnalis]|uniref:Sex-determining region Y protein n=1 Tax=Lymnaea stagnalis TaxID=6523 RepID=A0AAV2I7S8_LYMST